MDTSTGTNSGPIVVGVDESDTSRRAAFTAAELARALGAPLHLVMSVSRTRTQAASSGGDQWSVDWLSTAEQFLDALVGELRVPQTTRTVSTDDPAAAICDEAVRLHARMIVVGNRRMQGLSRVLGAVATDIARRSPCDVLIAYTKLAID